MSEFEVNLKGLKNAVSKEEDVIKDLQKEIEKLDAVISSSALNKSGFGNVVASLKSISAQLKNEKTGVRELKNCLSDAITLYEKTEKNLAQGNKANKKIKQSIEKLGELLEALLKEEKYGENDNSSVMCGDPVNMSTGNFIYDHADLKVAGGIPLTFRRFYNALDTKKGVLGVHFLHNYEISLEAKKAETEEGAEKIIICMGDGQRKSFIKIAEGNYIGERAARETLTENENGYCLNLKDGGHYYFNEKGMLLRQENQNGRGISFFYDEETGLLQKAENDDGNYLNYHYDAAGKLTCVSDIEDRKVQLSYDGDYLTCVQMADGQTSTYTYTEDGNMETITNPNQTVVLKNYYEKDQRVIRQEMADGGCMTYEYDDAGHRTIMTAQNGNRTTYVQDEKYRNTDILYEDGTTEHFEYNEKNQKIKAVDRNGHTSQMAYDHHGNLTQVIYENGMKINYTYDCNNKLLCLKVNGKEKLHNTYDAKGNLIASESVDGAANKVVYDEKGRAIRLETNRENITQLSYDAYGNIEKITDALGGETTYLYDRLGRAIETIDANGNKTTYEYDIRDRLTRIKNPLGLEQTYRYTPVGKVAEFTDFDGHSIKAIYTCLNKVESYTDKEGNETRFTYDKMWNVSSKITADGAVTEYHHNKNNWLEKIVLPDEGTLTYEYDGNGNRIAETDAEGNRTTYTYDEMNRNTSVTTADGQTTSYYYDKDGNLAMVCDAMGNEYTYHYDDAGRKIRETDPLGNITTYSYYQGQKIDTITYPNGSKQHYEYDLLGRIQKITNPDGSSRMVTYDKVGNILEEADGDGNAHRYQYDALGRLIAITAPNGTQRAFTYDAVGNITKAIDENGNITHYTYSPNGNLLQVTDALGNKTKYEYDCMNRLCKVERIGTSKHRDNICGEHQNAGKNQQGLSETDQNKYEVHQVTTYEWDKAGRLRTMTDPLGFQEIYSYNKNGMLTSKTDRDGYQTSYTYDMVGNLTNILFEDSREVTYSYNALRQLKEINDWLGKTTMELDALGRPLSVTDHMGKKVQYRWNNIGARTEMIYPDGSNVHYEYDTAGRLSTLTEGGNMTSYRYHENGELAEKILPNGIRTTYQYNELGRLESLTHAGKDEKESFVFAYDANGNKIRATRQINGHLDEGRSYEYQYDAMNQLIGVVQGRKTVRSYAYDAFGNRIEKRDYTGEQPLHTTYQYNVKNQLIEEYRNDTLEAAKEFNINPFDTIKKYSYDGRGNLTKIMQDKTLQRQFEFDETNQLRASFEMQGDITKAARYTYNGLGQRVGQETYVQQMEESLQPLSKIDFAKLQPENRFSYLLDITKDYNNLLEQTDAVSGKSQQFFWDTNVISMQEDGEDNFYLQDALGSVMNLIDKQGNSLERYEFDEFGVPIAGPKSVSRQPFAFTGYQMDAVGGMYFAQARRYDANAGRFISEDKIRGTIAAPFTMNHYGYCWNRPVDFVDWNGLSPEQPEFLKKGNEAHTLLQAKFMADYGGKGGQVEYYIRSGINTNSSGTGRADIVYFNSATKTVEVYEIKPGSYALGAIYHAVGLAQLDRYVYALNNNGQIVNGWNAITGVSLQ